MLRLGKGLEKVRVISKMLKGINTRDFQIRAFSSGKGGSRTYS